MMKPSSLSDPPYPSTAIAATHPARLCAAMMLHGGRFVFDEGFSYLELGCGDGTNLLALAAQFPEARFTGIDIDARAIARGDEIRQEAGLENVKLLAADVRNELLHADARFDYVVAHGIYSWVPPEVQTRILELASRHLAYDGVFYCSYNTLPGWAIRGIVRDSMRMATKNVSNQAARLRAAKAAATRIGRHHLGEKHPYGQLLATELELIQGKADAYLLGDYLSEHNEPLYFNEFVNRAGKHGLSYLSETLPATPDGSLEATVLHDVVASGLSRIEAEQQLDIVGYRQFRGTLLVHADQSITDEPDYGILVERGYFASSLQPTSQEPLLGPGKTLDFRTVHGVTIEVDRPLLKAALLELAKAWPRGLRTPEIITTAVAALRERGLLEACALDQNEIERTVRDLVILSARRQIEFLPWTPQTLQSIAPRPFAVPLHRVLAARGNAVTSPRHEPLFLDEPTRLVLESCDGTRDHSAITREIGIWADSGQGALTPEQREALGRRETQSNLAQMALDRLLALGLLVPAPSTRALPSV